MGAALIAESETEAAAADSRKTATSTGGRRARSLLAWTLEARPGSRLRTTGGRSGSQRFEARRLVGAERARDALRAADPVDQCEMTGANRYDFPGLAAERRREEV